jgi:hypothetical protein
MALFTMADEEEEEGPWCNSATHCLLVKDMKDGLIPLEGGKMPPRVTWMQQPEYTIIPYEKFCQRLGHLRCTIIAKNGRAVAEMQVLVHDR